MKGFLYIYHIEDRGKTVVLWRPFTEACRVVSPEKRHLIQDVLELEKNNMPVPINDFSMTMVGTWSLWVSGKDFFSPLAWKRDERQNMAYLEKLNMCDWSRHLEQSTQIIRLEVLRKQKRYFLTEIKRLFWNIEVWLKN